MSIVQISVGNVPAQLNCTQILASSRGPPIACALTTSVLSCAEETGLVLDMLFQKKEVDAVTLACGAAESGSGLRRDADRGTDLLSCSEATLWCGATPARCKSQGRVR